MARPLVVAHQGGARQWPGNSLRAFEAVARSGVDVVEFDVHQTADGELVVLHDPLVDVDGLRVPVSSLRGEDIRALRGATGDGLPLTDILRVLQPGPSLIQIDVKTDHRGVPYPGLLPALARDVEALGEPDRIILSSFLTETLAQARSLFPTAALRSGLMPLVTEQLGGALSALLAYRHVGASIIDINLAMIDETLIYAAANAGMVVGVGVVNGSQSLSRWLQAPVARVLTDEPDLAMRLRSRAPA